MESFDVKCGACNHSTRRCAEENFMPPEGTPPEKICYELDDKWFSFLCTDPKCNCFTIYRPHQQALEDLKIKFEKS